MCVACRDLGSKARKAVRASWRQRISEQMFDIDLRAGLGLSERGGGEGRVVHRAMPALESCQYLRGFSGASLAGTVLQRLRW